MEHDEQPEKALQKERENWKHLDDSFTKISQKTENAGFLSSYKSYQILLACKLNGYNWDFSIQTNGICTKQNLS